MNTIQFLPNTYDSGADALSMGQALQSKLVLGGARASQVPTQLGAAGNAAGLVNRPVFLHQPQTLRPANAATTTTRLAAGTQLINAYNADGQPVTIAVNPNGTHQVLTGVSAAPAGNTLTLSNGNSISIQQPAVQVQQVRQLQAAGTTTALINTPQGQRLVQLSNSDLQAATAAPQGVTYKLVQQAVPTTNGTRILVQQAAPNGTVVQRMVQPSANMPLAAKPSALAQLAVRAATPTGNAPQNLVAAGQQVSGMQVNGQTLVQMAAPMNTVTAYNPATGLRTTANNAQLAGVQQANAANLQLPSAVLVRPSGGVEGMTQQQLQAVTLQLQQNGGGSNVPSNTAHGGNVQVSLQPVQSLQQQVKDTAAQQRQQQLLASLRARVASLSQVQPAGGAPTAGAAPAAAAQVNGNMPQVILKPTGQHGPHQQQVVGLRMGSDNNNSANAQAGLLQSLLNAQHAARQGLAQQQQQQQQRMLDEQQQQQLNLLNLTPAQQQALLGGTMPNLSNGGGFRVNGSDGSGNAHGQQVVHNNGTFFSLAGNPALTDELLQQNAAFKQQLKLSDSLDGGKANLGLSTAASSMNDAMSAASAPAGTRGVNSPTGQLGLNNMMMLGGLPRASNGANEMQQQTGKDDLKSILMSIGLELARHGIPVSTAVEAGWLGVLSPTDIAVLHATYEQEQRRLADANNANAAAAALASQGMGMGQQPGSAGMPEVQVPPGLMGWPHLSAVSSLASEPACPAGHLTSSVHSAAHSPAASVHSSGFGPAGLGATGPALTADARSTPAPNDGSVLAEIDDARFSAFAYDFFGGMESGDGLGTCGVGSGGLLEPLEPTTAGSKRSSSADVAPLRAPSWPADGPSVHAIKTVAAPSVASFSELGHATSGDHPSSATTAKDNCDAVSTASSSNNNNQELVARISNLDLGCGFY